LADLRKWLQERIQYGSGSGCEVDLTSDETRLHLPHRSAKAAAVRLSNRAGWEEVARAWCPRLETINWEIWSEQDRELGISWSVKRPEGRVDATLEIESMWGFEPGDHDDCLPYEVSKLDAILDGNVPPIFESGGIAFTPAFYLDSFFPVISS
jgi:hypothetical protein